MVKSFEFSYCLDEVEFIENMENITEEEGEEIVKKLMKSDEIYVGERTKGVVSFDDEVQPIIYNVDYEYCSEVGEDWGDDVWEELSVQVQL
jgi:predicted AlkP superfamily phosphohydrolase/phosphomutase